MFSIFGMTVNTSENHGSAVEKSTPSRSTDPAIMLGSSGRGGAKPSPDCIQLFRFISGPLVALAVEDVESAAAAPGAVESSAKKGCGTRWMPLK
jgi:hypothetical protein